jgi:hypothetical protein
VTQKTRIAMAVSRPMIAMRRMSSTLGTGDQETLSGP